MSFKLCNAEDVRHDIAYYHKATDQEKNQIWMYEVGKPYHMIDDYFKNLMDQTSRLVKIYIETTDEKDKEALWNIYDRYTKLFCDLKKYRTTIW